MNEAKLKLPQSITELKSKDIERFWDKVRIGNEEECWHWQASTDPCGYGKLAFGKLLMSAHRLAYLIHHGAIVGGVVMHTCDNPPCVNPKHLILGTDALNAADKAKKARSAWGTRHPCCRLTEANIHDIRQRRNKGEKLRVLAADYNITIAHVFGICSRRYWRHLA